MAVYSYGPVKPRIRFGRTEIGHIILAVTVLTFAFALLFRFAPDLDFLEGLALAAVAVPLGFLLHELGHKVVAQRYGYLAEFRAWAFGLVLALFTAFFGLLFAAPGAVVIQGFGTRGQTGRISAAGPLVNLAIGGAAGLLWYVLLTLGVDLAILGSLTLVGVAAGVAFVNFILGAFNLIPFPPLDGSKIIRWDLRVYVGLVIPLGTLAVLGFLFLNPFR